jgi:hypothetical protein
MIKVSALAGALMVLAGSTIVLAMPNDPDTTPGGRRFCEQYASTTADVVADAVRRNPSCLDYRRGVHANTGMHFDWCMRTPRTEVQGAADNIRRLVSQCSAPAVRPGAPPPAGRESWYCRAKGDGNAISWARSGTMERSRQAVMQECGKKSRSCQLLSCNRE